MADVATLVFDIDSSGAAGAAKALAGLNRYAATTATVAAKLETKFRRANGQFQSQIDYVAENEAEIRRLAASYNSTLSAQLRFAEAQKEVARAVQLGVIPVERQADVLRELQAQYAPLSARQGAVIAQAGQLSGGFRNMTSHIQNAGYQIGDFAVQVASGQNAMMAMSQQLPQLLGGFGAWGAVAGAVTAILGAGYMVWSNAAGAAATLEDNVSSLSQRLSALDAAVELSLIPMDQLIAKYGAAAGAAREWLLINIQKEVMETNDALRKQASAISDIASEYASALNPTMEMLRVELNAIEDDFGLVGSEANQFREILFSIRNADGLEKQVEYLEEMRVFLKDNNIEIAKMPDGFAKSLVSLSPLVAKAWELAQANSAAAAAALGMTKRTPLYEQGWSNDGLLPPTSNREPEKKRRGGGGGGGALKQAEKQFQSLRELLEKESIFQVAEYEKRQLQLENALNKKLVTMQQFQEMEAQLRTYYFGTEFEKRQLEYDLSLEQLRKHLEAEQITRQQYDIKAGDLHSQKVTELGNQDANRYSNDLGNLAKHMGEMNTIAGGGYDGLLKAQRVFGAASALISTYTGAAEALKLPFPYNLAAAGKVIAAGLGFVSAIKGGGSGGGSSSASATAAATRQEPSKTILVRLDGPDWATELVGNVITQLQEQSKDGRYIIQRD